MITVLLHSVVAVPNPAHRAGPISNHRIRIEGREKARLSILDSEWRDQGFTEPIGLREIARTRSGDLAFISRRRRG
jgi:hypothetical protein